MKHLTKVATAFLLGAVMPAQAIVIRHDVADADYRTLAANAKYAAVGLLEFENENARGIGTGNYIGVGTGGKKWLVTAGHVLDRDLTSLKFTVGGRIYDVEISSMRWWTSHESGRDDIAVARILDPDNTLTVAPARFWNSTLPIPNALGDRLTGTVVGFGQTGVGNSNDRTTDKVKRAMQNRIDALNLTYNRGNDELYGYISDFDKNDAANNTLDKDDFPAANLWAGQKSERAWLGLEGAGDEGDSGGGLFTEIGNRTVMIGVTSAATRLGTGGRSTYGSYTQYSPFNREFAQRIDKWTGIKAVPEPSTLLVVLGGCLFLRRRVSS
ncbi:MAG: trypsin-like serine protease [Fimbriimonadaceae bacterium]|nr:trypsin-like serine protease [Fimbriimonadaceae bacterium]